MFFFLSKIPLKIISGVFFSVFFWSSCQPYDRVTKISTELPVQDSTSLLLMGSFIDVSSIGVESFGHVIGLDTPVSIQDNIITAQGTAEQGPFNTQAQNLILDTLYYYRSFAMNSDGELVYGMHKSLSTSSTHFTLKMRSAELISQGNLQTTASILNPFGTNVMQYGHCIRIGEVPTIYDERTQFGPSNNTLSFQSEFSKLFPGQIYLIRAYAITSDNRLFYSNTLSTLMPEYIVRTDTAQIQNNNVYMRGSLLNMGLDPIEDHGFCYSFYTSNPNLNNSVITMGSLMQVGSFESTIPLPGGGQALYYRAYIVFGNKIVYGGVKNISL